MMEEPSKSSLLSILNEELSPLERSSGPSYLVPEGSLTSTLKRTASPSYDESVRRKRFKECEDDDGKESGSENAQGQDECIDGQALVEDLTQELQCGCCSELVYKPVIVSPCQHFFCGSCCVLWIKNGGTNCPACRGQSTAVTPSRALQTMVDVLLRATPSRARTEREKLQADEVYPSMKSLKIPVPREPSPEPAIAQNDDYIRPCPHCLPGNPFGWRCPHPIADPAADAEHAWHIDDGAPPGHGYCGNCEVILALEAPTTTKCDLCQVSFCGINVQGRCIAVPLMNQHLHRLSDIGDLIESAQLYEAFDGNTVEVEIMLDYMTAQHMSPRHLYREIIAHIQSLPRGFSDLIEQELFADLHGVGGGIDPNPSAPRTRICRWCAAKVFMWGLREWWVRERKKGFLDESVTTRKDCPDGQECRSQTDLAHAKEFNHIIMPLELPVLTASTEPEHGPIFPPSDSSFPTLPSLAELGIPPSTLLPRLGDMLTSPTPEPINAEMEAMASSSSHLNDAMDVLSHPHYMESEPGFAQSEEGSNNGNDIEANDREVLSSSVLTISSIRSELQNALGGPSGLSSGGTDKPLHEDIDMFMGMGTHPSSQITGLLDYTSS